MNDKFDASKNRPQGRKPSFQQPTSGSRFSSRDEQPRNRKRDEGGEKRFPENRTSSRLPRQERDKRDNRERREPRRDNRDRQDGDTAAYVWSNRELSANKAGKNSSGNVKVMIKGEVKGEKKTGPLSPRAPEKIRKNRNEEMKIYGEAACLALFRQRPDSIVRLWATVEMSHKIGEMMSYLAGAKKAYHVVDSEELERVSGSEHHGGICLLVKKAAPMSLGGYLQTPKRQDCILWLQGVNNAHNLGSVIRTAAYYGVKGVVCESADKLYSAASARVAEGGMEHIYALESGDSETALAQLKAAGYQVVALTANKQAQPLDKLTFGDKVVFVLRETVSAESDSSADQQVVLSFENPLSSGLNVAVNAGILLSRWYFR
ncbi:TrmH family RNA methyltransferase [Testudinibacter sp. P27/CKL/0425]